MSNPYSRNLADRQGRMHDKLVNKMGQTIGKRADMYLSDSLPIDANSCHVMVNFDKNLGPVTAEEITAFVIREFKGSVLPRMETARMHTAHAAVTLIVSRANTTRPLEDKDHMMAIAGAVFIDQTLNETWEVETSADGQKYLQRVSDDDIGQIVAERRRRMSVAGTQELTIASAIGQGGLTQVGPGDMVKVFYRDSVHADCTVQSATNTDVTVKIPNVGSVTLAREAVVQVQQISAKREKAMLKDLEEYYKQVYGPEYAKMLSRDTTQS